MLLRIYTEGDLLRGLGHLTRCSAYAAAWRQREGRVCWVVDGDDTARRVLQDENVDWRAWQAEPVTVQQEAVAIVDSYIATLPVLQSISDNYRQVVFLDDTFRLPYPQGHVVHPALDKPRMTEGAAKWHWGPSWQPLRSAFWDVSRDAEFPVDVQKILILMGGSDIRQLTHRMITLAKDIYPCAEINVVVGGGEGGSQNCILHRNLTDVQMASLMLSCDLAISAAGQTVFELAKCGTPSILICVADNQSSQIVEWPKKGAFLSAGWWSDDNLNGQVRDSLAWLKSNENRRLLSENSRAVMDQNGVFATVGLLKHGV